MSAIDHHDDHADEPWLQHHWNNSGQQFEAGKLGMWLFLATEFLLFAGLFCAYAVYRSNHPELFEYGAKFLDWKLGATNTAVLIASSFTMAWAVTAAQRGQVKLMNGLLFITFFGGENSPVFGFLRFGRIMKLLKVLRLLRVFRSIGLMNIGGGRNDAENALAKQSIQVIFTIMSVVVIASGFVHYLAQDNPGAWNGLSDCLPREGPLPDDITLPFCDEEQRVLFHDAMYFTVVTLATVGYGDLAPPDALSRLMVTILTMCFILWVPYETGKLMEMVKLRAPYGGEFVSNFKGSHIIVFCDDQF